MIGPTGIWSASEAKPEHYPKSEKLALNLAMIFSEHECVIDFGCGDCFYINQLNPIFIVFGLDGFIPEKRFNAPDVYNGVDLSNNIEFKGPSSKLITGQVLSLEVGEHIPKEFEEIFIDNLCRHCNSRMVLSWALPKQNGLGHVNCQPNEYIIDQITKRGFTFNKHVTDFLRTDIEQHVNYFRNTLMVFDKIS